MWSRNKIRILSWLTVILFAVSVSMAATLLYHKKQETQPAKQLIEEAIEVPAQQRTRFFSEELNLQSEQMDTFRELNRSFNRNASKITRRLETLRIEMVEELGSQNPDKKKLNRINRKIGDLHTELKNLTVDYYLGMKAESTPEQQERLNDIFM